MLTWILPLGLSVALPATDAATPDGRQAPPIAIHADRVEVGDGSALEDVVVLVEDGKITAVGADVAVPDGASEFHYEGVLSPGLIAGRSADGLAGETADGTRSVLGEARIAEGFDPNHADLRRARAAGVTSILLAQGLGGGAAAAPDIPGLPPGFFFFFGGGGATTDEQTLVPGQTAVVKSAGGVVVSPSAHLALSFSSAALDRDRYPTSYASARHELDALFDAGEGVFGRVSRGELGLFIDARTRAQVQRACAWAEGRGLRGAISGAALAGEIAETVKASGLSAILGPYGPGTSSRELEAAAALGAAGVPIAFGLDAPALSHDALRWTAALCHRAGLSREAAVSGLFANAADVVGAGGRLGRIAAGHDADFVVWSGDPLDLRSRVECVWIDGALVHHNDDEDDE